MHEIDYGTKMLTEQDLQFLAEFFKVLGDPTRMKILLSLFEGERCVNELASKLNVTDSAVSHQLHVLKAGKLVRKRRSGKLMFYNLSNEAVREIICQGISHTLSSARHSNTPMEVLPPEQYHTESGGS